MNHEVEVSNLMFNKTSEDKVEFKKYDINVELEEESSNEEKTILKYSLDLTSDPKNSVINISGNTILVGEPSEIEEYLKQEDEKTPQVVSLIYQELFPLMYIISKNMKIPSPAHTISKNNVKEDSDQITQQESSNEKIIESIQENKKGDDEPSESNQPITEDKVPNENPTEITESQNNESESK